MHVRLPCLLGVLLLPMGPSLAEDRPSDFTDLEHAAARWAKDGRGGAPSFVKHVVPLLGKLGCSNRSCHGSFQGQAGFRLSLFGYDPVLDYGELTNDDGGSRVDTDKPDESLVVRKALGNLGHEGGQRFDKTDWQYRVLRAWIAAGAKYEADDAPYLEKLEVVPAEVVLQPEQSVRLRTVAHFSDGTHEEVTPLTDFTSNDDGVAEAEDDGTIAATGTGDTAVVVSYGGGVVTAQVFVPRETTQPFPEFPGHNPVDRFVEAKLRKLGIHPSGLCTDQEFLRRAYVDVIGTLPTPDEVRAFLADDRPDKRARLVDELLNRPEYALFWGSRMADALGNSQSNLNNFLKVSNLVQQWLEDKLERNLPWDEFVGRIVAATSREGRSLEEYLEENETVAKNLKPKDGFDDGTYAQRKTLDLYWLRRGDDAEELATRAANAFLGIQIQCAECHKHPFDRWTQEDFASFASFFRVAQAANLDGSPRSGGRRDYDKVALYPGPGKKDARIVERTPPKILGGRVVEYEEGSDPRVELWEWMRDPENPYFARNIVNRMWGHYFGVGIVDPVDDANAANPPSNPRLLDWLAQDFIEHDFDLKHLHRRILNSRTYQLSYVPNATNRDDRRNFSHALVKRMPAEVALDALVHVTGTELKFNRYAAPPGTRAIGLSASTRFGDPEYFLSTFGRPKRVQTCSCERSNEPALAQALFLINDEDVHARITDPDGRLTELLETIDSDGKLVEELYLTCLSRFPTSEERERVLGYFETAETRRAAAEDLLWSLVNVREFLFVK